MSKNKIVRLTGPAVGGALRGMLVMGAGWWVPVKYARDVARVSTQAHISFSELSTHSSG